MLETVSLQVSVALLLFSMFRSASRVVRESHWSDNPYRRNDGPEYISLAQANRVTSDIGLSRKYEILCEV